MKSKTFPPSAEALATLLGDEILATTDQDVDQILQALGLDPAEAVKEVDAAFKAAMKERSAAQLAAARQRREVEIERLRTGEAYATASREELLAMVTRRFKLMEPLQGTLMHRDFENDTEQDLRSVLCQLDALENPKGEG